MKFNWGTGIAIFYTIFAMSMLTLVWQSRKQDISLVRDDYYAADLAYQEQYDKASNSLGLEQDVTIEEDQATGLLVVQFPKEMRRISGEIVLFRPSDKRQDLKVPIQVDAEQRVRIPMAALSTGLWKVKIDWAGDGTPYYKEQTLVRP